MTTLATRIAHDHQPTATGCSCGKRLVAPKCARGSLMPFVEHVVEVAQEAVAAEIVGDNLRAYLDEMTATPIARDLS